MQNKYGIICDVSLEALTNAMRNVINKKDENIEKNIKKYKGSNDAIIKDLKKLFKIKGESLWAKKHNKNF